jgi:hypothetical protein
MLKTLTPFLHLRNLDKLLFSSSANVQKPLISESFECPKDHLLLPNYCSSFRRTRYFLIVNFKTETCIKNGQH